MQPRPFPHTIEVRGPLPDSGPVGWKHLNATTSLQTENSMFYAMQSPNCTQSPRIAGTRNDETSIPASSFRPNTRGFGASRVVAVSACQQTPSANRGLFFFGSGIPNLAIPLPRIPSFLWPKKTRFGRNCIYPWNQRRRKVEEN